MTSFFLKLAVSAALITLLLRGIDAEALLRHVTGVEARALAAAILLLAALSLVQTLRWRAIVRRLGGRLPFATLWLTVLIGQFFNQTLPSTVGGDGMRIWRAYRAGLDLAAAANGVILDRLAGLAGLLAISALGLPGLFALAGEAPARWAIPAVIAAGAGGFFVLMVMDRLPAAVLRWRAVRWAAVLSVAARRVFLSPVTAATVLGWSLLVHLVVVLVTLILARGLGIAIGLVDCLILVPPVVLVSTLPVSIAGWGVREGAMVVALGFAGVAPEAALALSVLFGLAVMVVGLPGGLIWFATGRERAGRERAGRERSRTTIGPAGKG